MVRRVLLLHLASLLLLVASALQGLHSDSHVTYFNVTNYHRTTSTVGIRNTTTNFIFDRLLFKDTPENIIKRLQSHCVQNRTVRLLKDSGFPLNASRVAFYDWIDESRNANRSSTLHKEHFDLKYGWPYVEVDANLLYDKNRVLEVSVPPYFRLNAYQPERPSKDSPFFVQECINLKVGGWSSVCEREGWDVVAASVQHDECHFLASNEAVFIIAARDPIPKTSVPTSGGLTSTGSSHYKEESSPGPTSTKTATTSTTSTTPSSTETEVPQLSLSLAVLVGALGIVSLIVAVILIALALVV